MENIGSTWLTGSLGTRLWIWAQWLDRTCDRVDEASFELHGMRRRRGMVYS
jgi:type IV secretory pathway TrbD component